MNTILFFIELRDIDNYIEYEKYIEFIKPAKQMHISKYKFLIDKKLSLISDLFVRYQACKILHITNTDLLFEKNSFGKPYLAGYPDFHYNISHTRNAIIIGISGDYIGVDIEKIKSVDMKIAERFFNKNELLFILSNTENQDMLFYEIWTKKEAYIKWTGKGLSLPLTKFDVMSYPINKMLYTYEVNNYIISVCSKELLSKIDIAKMDERQIIRILSNFLN